MTNNLLAISCTVKKTTNSIDLSPNYYTTYIFKLYYDLYNAMYGLIV